MRGFSRGGKFPLSAIGQDRAMPRAYRPLDADRVSGDGRSERDRAGARSRRRPARRRLRMLVATAVLTAVGGAYVAAKPGAQSVASRQAAERTYRSRLASSHRVTSQAATVPHVVVTPPPASLPANWAAVAQVHGHPAAWITERSGVALMRFDQSLVHLTLHAGSTDGGVTGWKYGDQITPAEIHLVVAAFNGGFKLTYTNVGFVSDGHVAVALKPGLGSVVTYTDGTTGIGAWDNGVPTSRKTVFSVLQNQQLLVDRGGGAPP